MKNLIIMLCVIVSICSGCEPENEDIDLSVQDVITELAAQGFRVDVDVKFGEVRIDGELYGVFDNVNVAVKHYALTECDPFGWGSEYDWLCRMNPGSNGRALGRQPVGDPVSTDLAYYAEVGSDEMPAPPTSYLYFSRKVEHYPKYLDTNANPSAFFGLVVAAFGPTWSLILAEYCTNTHIPFCIQE